MKKNLLMAVMVATGLTACSSYNPSGEYANEGISKDNIAQKWQLAMVDQQAISADGSPTLMVNSDMVVSGYTGCNRYFGNAQIEDNRFRIDRMASTKMACSSQAMNMEQTVSHVLSDWSMASISNDMLSLSNEQHTLIFKNSTAKKDSMNAGEPYYTIFDPHRTKGRED
ncbi:hypothetical protein BZJ19_09305 [Salinivibrio proteolyticus]|uniref:META domain-containing protein n=1 Tax=Salinivibrio proteolyticus TaxID=334715 RepID=UPI000989102A|nr:META domain-containing protein [Salinivibrio proteolyticus]OOF25208.1 hypothetical protein BZJ19_09305 [Salinivibrio proteolyticus]